MAVKSGGYYGPDWFDPPSRYLDQYGRIKKGTSLVYSHLCFDPHNCPNVTQAERDAFPVETPSPQ